MSKFASMTDADFRQVLERAFLAGRAVPDRLPPLRLELVPLRPELSRYVWSLPALYLEFLLPCVWTPPIAHHGCG